MANEKRLIDANKVINAMQKCIDDAPFAKGTITYSSFEAIIECLKQEPTVDAAEVVHGRWVSLTECANAGVYCSVCNKKVYKEDYAWCNRKNKLRSNYCPNCGAKMDGGNEDV